MKEISDLHYLSPSGCTFWGKKPWSRKKKLLWQLGTLVGAPLGIALVAGIAVPAMIIGGYRARFRFPLTHKHFTDGLSFVLGIPVWVGRKIHARYKAAGKHKRNFAVLGGVTASVSARNEMNHMKGKQTTEKWADMQLTKAFKAQRTRLLLFWMQRIIRENWSDNDSPSVRERF